MRILLITQTLRRESGWGTFSRSIALELQQRGHTVLTLVHKSDATCASPQEEILPDALEALRSPVAWLTVGWKIATQIRRFKPDVVHVLVEPYAPAMQIARLCTKMPPWVMNLHGTYSVVPFEEPKTRFLFARAFQNAAGFLVCSNFTLAQVRQAVSTYAPHVLPHLEHAHRLFTLGIEPPAHLPTHASHNAVKQILFVGGIKPRKGIRELIEACGVFHKISNTPFHLTLVGTYDSENSYAQELQRRIHALGLDGMVSFPGHISPEEVERAYAQSDLFVMLSLRDGSHFEGFGLVYLEANIRGIPVIGSRDSGCREAISDGVSGFAIDPTNAAAAAERMREILEKNVIRPDACREWARQHSITRQGDACEALYRCVTTRAPRS